MISLQFDRLLVWKYEPIFGCDETDRSSCHEFPSFLFFPPYPDGEMDTGQLARLRRGICKAQVSNPKQKFNFQTAKPKRLIRLGFRPLRSGFLGI